MNDEIINLIKSSKKTFKEILNNTKLSKKELKKELQELITKGVINVEANYYGYNKKSSAGKKGVVIKFKTNQVAILVIILLFALSFYLRNIAIIVNGYPPVFIDYVGHTLSMLNTIENFWTLFSPDFTTTPSWYREGDEFLDKYWWFQINPPLAYIIGDILVTPFIKDVNTGWVTGALFYSINVLTIYYLIKYFTKDTKTALIASILYTTCAGDLFSISKGTFLHALAMSLYPLALIFTHKLINQGSKKNLIITTVLLWGLINSYTIYIAVYLISLITYYSANSIKIKNWRLIIKKPKGKYREVIISILLSVGLSTIFIIRFIKSTFLQVFSINAPAPLITLLNINLLPIYFPHDSFGVMTYNYISITIKIIISLAVILSIYYLIKNKLKINTYLLYFFSGPVIFYLMQYVGFTSYPRRILFQSPQLLSIAGAVSLIWIINKLPKRINKNYLIIIFMAVTLVFDVINTNIVIKDVDTIIMNDDRYEALLWMRNNVPDNETVYFLNSYSDFGYSDWANFAYKKHVTVDYELSSALIIYGKMYDELLNYDYVVVTNILNNKLVNKLMPVFNEYNYSIIFKNSEVGVFLRNA